MQKRTKKTTKRKAEIAAAIELINRSVASKFNLPMLTQSFDISEELVDTKTAARVLGVSTKTLANWRTSGVVDLSFIKIGSRVKYRSSDLNKFLLSRSHQSTSGYPLSASPTTKAETW